MVRSNYENSVASLLGQIQSNRERLDALRLEDANASSRLKVNEANDVDFAEITQKALNEVSVLSRMIAQLALVRLTTEAKMYP